MKKRRNKKGYLAAIALMAAAALWLVPIKAEAFCSDWSRTDRFARYCATPICHTGNRTYFVQREYQRMCIDELGNPYMECRVETTDNGCCLYN